MTKKNIENLIEQDAACYLEDLAYLAMLGLKEPARSAEILAAIGKSEYSPKLLRFVLTASPKFAEIDRRWDLETRYEDKQRPMERVLRSIMEGCGFPMSVEHLAGEIASVYGRPAEYYETTLPRMLGDTDKYFMTSDGLYGLNSWLLEVTSDEEEDLILDNDLNADELKAIEKAAGKTDWSKDDAAAAMVKVVGGTGSSVSGKAVQLMMWKALGDDFDAAEMFDRLHASDSLIWLSKGAWASAKSVEDYDVLLMEMADKVAEETAEEPVQKAAEKKEAAKAEEPTLTLNISERDLDEVAQIVSEKGEARMASILETIFEISPRDPIYAVAAEGLTDSMKKDGRFVWVGFDRWCMADGIPEDAAGIPEGLEISKLSFQTVEGDEIEVEIDDDGLEGDLAKEIKSPLVQDVGDCEPVLREGEGSVAKSARLVLARHHKRLGIYPVCRLPQGFLGSGPDLVKITLTDKEKTKDVWANFETGVMYDMGEWFGDDLPDSGAVIELARTDDEGVFLVSYPAKPEAQMTVAADMVEELERMAGASANRSTLELVSDIVNLHKKGASFIRLFTEVNIVRRTTRRLVASILSSYYAFYQHPKTGLWQYDVKKEDQGFKKAKKKYVIKD